MAGGGKPFVAAQCSRSRLLLAQTAGMLQFVSPAAKAKRLGASAAWDRPLTSSGAREASPDRLQNLFEDHDHVFRRS